jgi:formate dehydrogenase
MQNKVVGTVGAGRIGQRVLERLVPFNCKELLYFDYGRLPADVEKATGAKYAELEVCLWLLLL